MPTNTFNRRIEISDFEFMKQLIAVMMEEATKAGFIDKSCSALTELGVILTLSF